MPWSVPFSGIMESDLTARYYSQQPLYIAYKVVVYCELQHLWPVTGETYADRDCMVDSEIEF